MFDCCLRRPLEAKDSSENLSTRRTFLMSGTGRQPSLGHLSAARADYASSELEESSSGGRSPRPYVIRAMRPEELDQAYKIRLQTNYVFAKSTIETSWKMQPDSFLVAVSDEEQVLGSISWRRFASDLMIMEQLTVHRDHHGQGIGRELLAALVDKLSENLMVRIPEPIEPDFVREMPPFPYRSSTVLLSTWAAPLCLERMPAEPDGVTVEPIKSEDLDGVLRYDRDVFHCDRAELVTRLVQASQSACVFALNEEFEILGYAVVQEMSNDTRDVSVLLADDAVTAASLLRALIQQGDLSVSLTLTSPAPPDRRGQCFAIRAGFQVREAYVCRFTRQELLVDYARVFSFGTL